MRQSKKKKACSWREILCEPFHFTSDWMTKWCEFLQYSKAKLNYFPHSNKHKKKKLKRIPSKKVITSVKLLVQCLKIAPCTEFLYPRVPIKRLSSLAKHNDEEWEFCSPMTPLIYYILMRRGSMILLHLNHPESILSRRKECLIKKFSKWSHSFWKCMWDWLILKKMSQCVPW